MDSESGVQSKRRCVCRNNFRGRWPSNTAYCNVFLFTWNGSVVHLGSTSCDILQDRNSIA